jgi:hypothetical protein
MPAGCAAGALTGHFTSPRISFATCSALAAPEGTAGDKSVALFALFDPQAANESAAHAHVTHSKRLTASLRRREIQSPFLCAPNCILEGCFLFLGVVRLLLQKLCGCIIVYLLNIHEILVFKLSIDKHLCNAADQVWLPERTHNIYFEVVPHWLSNTFVGEGRLNSPTCTSLE